MSNKTFNVILACCSLGLASALADDSPRQINGSRHLWVDKQLVDTMDDNLSFALHHPREEGPFETQPSGYYMTIIQEDSGLMRAYYRGYLQSIYGADDDEFTAYAESTDGIHWVKPRLGIVKFPNDPDQNGLIWKVPEIPFAGLCHNVSPFIDRSPDCPPDERYKAIGGTPSLGLYALVSPDGLHWQVKPDHPIIPREKVFGTYGFDSHNVALYNTLTGEYEIYYRVGLMPNGDGLRTVWRTSSKNFFEWEPGEHIGPNLPDENLYTLIPNQYFRAPDYLLCFPSRYQENGSSYTDILFMSKWRDQPLERLFKEAIIRPGGLEAAWGNRKNYISQGLFKINDREVAVYENLNKRRFVWRIDGFTSLHAGENAGEMTTKPFIFQGSRLTFNGDTSAGGFIRFELQTADGQVIPEFALDKCQKFIGDKIDVTAEWEGSPDLSPYAGTPVRLRVSMLEADFYSFKFE